jgi:hypothetical protein
MNESPSQHQPQEEPAADAPAQGLSGNAVTRCLRSKAVLGKRIVHILAFLVTALLFASLITDSPWASAHLAFRGLSGIATVTTENALAAITVKDDATADQLAAVLERTTYRPTQSVTYGKLTFTDLPVTSRPKPEEIRQTALLAATLKRNHCARGTVSGSTHADFNLRYEYGDIARVLAVEDAFDVYTDAWNTHRISGSDFAITRRVADKSPTSTIVHSLASNNSISSFTFSTAEDPERLSITMRGKDEMLTFRATLLDIIGGKSMDLMMYFEGSADKSLSISGTGDGKELIAAADDLDAQGFAANSLVTSTSNGASSIPNGQVPQISIIKVPRERWNEVKSTLLKYPGIAYVSIYNTANRSEYRGKVSDMPAQ